MRVDWLVHVCRRRPRGFVSRIYKTKQLSLTADRLDTGAYQEYLYSQLEAVKVLHGPAIRLVVFGGRRCQLHDHT